VAAHPGDHRRRVRESSDLSFLPSSSSHSPPPLSFLSMLSRVGSLNIDVSMFGRERGSTNSVLGARPHHSSAPHIADQVCEAVLQGSSVYSLLPSHVLCPVSYTAQPPDAV